MRRHPLRGALAALCALALAAVLLHAWTARAAGPAGWGGGGAGGVTSAQLSAEATSRAAADLATASALAAQLPKVGREFFVSPAGSDSNPGTLAAPFLTLTYARTQARAAIAAGLPDGGVAVTLRGGAYHLTASFVLSAADSGTKAKPVTWRAFPGETPRLIGGPRITGWTAVTSGDASWGRIYGTGIYKATPTISYGDADQVPGLNRSIPELYWNGEVMTRGRWPNAGSFAGIASLAADGTTTITSSTTLPAHNWAAAAALADANKPWFWVTRTAYADVQGRITAVSGNTMDWLNLHWDGGSVLASAANRIMFNGQLSAAQWYATNLLEEVDQAGEYWIDRTSGATYFKAPGDVDPDTGEAVISNFSGPILNLDSTSTWITIQGLTVESAQRNAVYVNGAYNTLRGSKVKNATGVCVWVGGTRHTIDRNEITACGFAGLVLHGSWDRNGVQWQTSSWPESTGWTQAQSILVTNNDIHRTNRNHWSSGGMVVLAGEAHTIRNNRIHDGPGVGILHVGGVGHLIERNEFFAVPNQGSDLGTIYASWVDDAGTTIQHNYFHDIPRPVAPFWPTGGSGGQAAVYLDDDEATHDKTTGYTIHGNLFHRLGDVTAACTPGVARCNVGILMKSGATGHLNVMTNNLFVRTDTGLWQKPGMVTTATGNQTWTTLEATTDAGGLTLTKDIAGNSIEVSPGFIDETGGQLGNAASGVLTVNGRSIPLASIGIQPTPTTDLSGATVVPTGSTTARALADVAASEHTLTVSYRNAALGAGVILGGHVLPSTRPFTVSGVTWRNSAAAATATGTMTLRVSDGTNNCDASVTCTGTDVTATGIKRNASAGACTFAPSAALTVSVAVACGTAQPTVQNLDVVGYWQ